MLPNDVSGLLFSLFGGCLYGYNTAIVAGISIQIVNNLHPNINNNPSLYSIYTGILTSCILLGGWLGSLLIVPVSARCGYRGSFLLIGLLSLVSSCLLAAINSFISIIMFRMLLGVSIGCVSVLSPLYTHVVCSTNNRDRIGCVFQISVCLSILCAQIVNYAFNTDYQENMDSSKYRIQLLLGFLPGMGIIFMAFRMSPIAAAHSPIVQPVVPASVETPWRLLFSKQYFSCLLLCFALSAANQLTGINTVIFYAPIIFKQSNVDNVLILTFSLVGGWNLLTSAASFILVQKVAMKNLLISSLLAMATGFVLLVIAYSALSGLLLSIVAILSICIVIAGFEFGPGPLFFVLATQSFPSPIQRESLSLCNQLCWIFNILVSFIFPVFNTQLGPAKTFAIFAAATILISILLALLMRKDGESPSLDKPAARGNIQAANKNPDVVHSTSVSPPLVVAADHRLSVSVPSYFTRVHSPERHQKLSIDKEEI